MNSEIRPSRQSRDVPSPRGRPQLIHPFIHSSLSLERLDLKHLIPRLRNERPDIRRTRTGEAQTGRHLCPAEGGGLLRAREPGGLREPSDCGSPKAFRAVPGREAQRVRVRCPGTGRRNEYISSVLLDDFTSMSGRVGAPLSFSAPAGIASLRSIALTAPLCRLPDSSPRVVSRYEAISYRCRASTSPLVSPAFQPSSLGLSSFSVCRSFGSTQQCFPRVEDAPAVLGCTKTVWRTNERRTASCMRVSLKMRCGYL